MKEIPIIFSASMVLAILDGRKTMTRRIIKPQPVEHDFGSGGVKFAFVEPQTKPGYIAIGINVIGPNDTAYLKRIPYGKPGDLLWVRESYTCYRQTNVECDEWEQVHGKHNRDYYSGSITPVYRADAKSFPDKWEPSIHMPRWASRITLEVTGVRVERLSYITNEDAIAEGIQVLPLQSEDDPSAWWQSAPGMHQDRTPRGVFIQLWESLHGTGSWNTNPFVWVVEFRKVQIYNLAQEEQCSNLQTISL